jgi:anti-sigma-K factor RskA
MSQPTHHDPQDDRLRQLEAEQALDGLSDQERLELDALQALGPAGRVDQDLPNEFELTVGALTVALHADAGRPLPGDLRQRILAASRVPPADVHESVVPAPPAEVFKTLARTAEGDAAGWRRREWLAWLSAAASLVVAAFFAARRTGADEPSPAELRRTLLAERGQRPADVLQIDWSATQDPAAAGAAGDVVWSDSRQQGVMRFRGLAANDPRQQQYQLWIFDAERDDAHPVDGGVFDIPAGASEVLVPIDARLPIGKAKMFAITVERPGGVVVSDRSRLPLLAQVP